VKVVGHKYVLMQQVAFAAVRLDCLEKEFRPCRVVE
jgi:hypothetical protein